MFDLTILTTAASSIMPTISTPEATITTIVMSASGFVSDQSVQQIAYGCFEVTKGFLYLGAAATIAYACWIGTDLSLVHIAEILHFTGTGREKLATGMRRIFGIIRRKSNSEKEEEEPDLHD